MQDAAYMVVVPHLMPKVPALRKNPVFLYYEDNFQRPNPFRPDIAVDLDSVIDKKIDALDSHVSQFYEWLPWVDGKLSEVPAGAAERKVWLKEKRTRTPSAQVRASLVKWYGAEKATRRGITKLSRSASTVCSRMRPGCGSYSRCCTEGSEESMGTISSRNPIASVIPRRLAMVGFPVSDSMRYRLSRLTPAFSASCFFSRDSETLRKAFRKAGVDSL